MTAMDEIYSDDRNDGNGGRINTKEPPSAKRAALGVENENTMTTMQTPLDGVFFTGTSRRGLTLIVDGSSLTPVDIDWFVRTPEAKVRVADAAMQHMQKSHALVQENMHERPIYGINTGFGPMVTQIIAKKDLVSLQYNLVRGHAVGMGNPIPDECVLAAMLVRLNTLVKGYSGVSPQLAEKLVELINHRVIPIIPEHGGVGASGDLVQLAHVALCVIGEGDVSYQGARRPARHVFAELHIEPHQLRPKEGLSLINGTSVMTGIGALLVCDARRIVEAALRNAGIAFEIIHGFTDVLDPVLHEARPHTGQAYVARTLRELTHDSQLMKDRHTIAHDVKVTNETHTAAVLLQEVYSFRCTPQILGPIVETLERAEKTISTEMNSVTDNPIVDVAGNRFLHGGNFHGDYVATAIDQMKAAIVKLTMLSERRSNFFLNKNVNKTFVPFLNLAQPGLTIALQGLQFVATSTTAHSQSLAFPHTVHSISTNGDNQDIVSMGTDAALIAQTVIKNAQTVLAIEMVTLSQAVEVTDTLAHLSTAGRAHVHAVRAHVPLVREDRPLTTELDALAATLHSEYEAYKA